MLKSLGTKENYPGLKMWFNHIVGPGYIWTPEIVKIYKELFLYFHGDPDTKLDLNKGIALVGTFGVGKSTIFQNLHTFLCEAYPFNSNLFRISSIEELIDDIREKGWTDRVFCLNHKEAARGGLEFKPIHLLINEFGHKYQAKVYGTDVNELLDMFIMKRYDIFQQYGKLLHVTTNHDIQSLQKTFPPRIIDRFKEMFSIIELKGKSFRK